MLGIASLLMSKSAISRLLNSKTTEKMEAAVDNAVDEPSYAKLCLDALRDAVGLAFI